MQTKRTRVAETFRLTRSDGSEIEARLIVTEATAHGANGMALGAPTVIGQRYETSAGQHLNPEDNGRFINVMTQEVLTRA